MTLTKHKIFDSETFSSKHGITKTPSFIPFYLFVFFLSVYLLTASEINIYFADVSEARLEVVKSLIERFELTVPKGVGIQGNDGREYSLFGLGSALLSLPFYLTGKFLGVPPGNMVSVMNQFAGAAASTLVFIFSISLGYSKRASLLTALFYGLGTIAWHYSKNPGDHAIEALFVLLSAYWMHRYLLGGKRIFLSLSALAVGTAFITRPTSILVIPALFVPMLLVKDPAAIKAKRLVKNLVLFLGLLIPFALVNFWYNYYRFGSLLETGYGLMAARLGLDFFTGTPFLTGLMGFLISPGKGFFFYSPVALLFFFSIKTFREKHPQVAACFMTISLSYLLFLCKNVYWHGDWAWGPRYLFVITPYLIIPIAEIFDSPAWFRRPGVRKAVFTLFVTSLAIQVSSVSVHTYRHFVFLRDERKIQFTVARGEGARPIIEPPANVYFDWNYSPILTHGRFIYEMSVNARKFLNTPPSNEQIRVEPWKKIFDFWWVYDYFVGKSLAGCAVAAILTLLAVSSLLRILSLTEREKL